MTTEKHTTPEDKNSIRLNKLLAERGLASRRGADKFIGRKPRCESSSSVRIPMMLTSKQAEQRPNGAL